MNNAQPRPKKPQLPRIIDPMAMKTASTIKKHFAELYTYDSPEAARAYIEDIRDCLCELSQGSAGQKYAACLTFFELIKEDPPCTVDKNGCVLLEESEDLEP